MDSNVEDTVETPMPGKGLPIDMDEKREHVDPSKTGPPRRKFKDPHHSAMASFMANSSSHSSTIFRRFDRVNMRNLLMLETEIARLEERLEKLEDETTHPYRSPKATNSASRTPTSKSMDEEIAEIAIELKEKIKEYYEAVLLTTEMLNLARPNRRSLHATRRGMWTHLQSTGIRAGATADSMSQYLNPAFENDLSVMAPQGDDDLVTRFFAKRFGDNSTGTSSSRSLTFAVSFISALCAVVFLVGAIVGLYFVPDTRSRLAMLSTFTLAFAATIAALTNARRQDVFVATAAYAAVLVVFVSGNIAANPIPTVCVLQNGGAANSATLGAALPEESGNNVATVPWSVATVFSTMLPQITTTPSMASTSMSQTTALPTAITKKGDMSDFAKTGIGVGASVGAIFCLLVIICGVVPWIRDKRWEGWGFGQQASKTRKREQKRHVEGSRGVWTFDREEVTVRDARDAGSTDAEPSQGRAVWV